MDFHTYCSQRMISVRNDGGRVVFVGMHNELIQYFLHWKLFDGLDFHFVSSHAPHHMGQVNFPNGLTKIIRPLSAISELDPNLVIILPQDEINMAQCLEYVGSLRKLSIMDILVVPQLWTTPLAGPDSAALIIGESIPKEIKGGLSSPDLVAHLGDALEYIAANDIPGDIVNMGVYQGWSLWLFAEMMQRLGLTDRTLWGFDTFEGFVDITTAEDGYVEHMKRSLGDSWNVHASGNASYEAVSRRFAAYPFVRLVKGDIAQTVRQLDGRPLALVLSDMDDYSPTAASLPTVYENLVPGGILAHDHFAYPSLAHGSCLGQRLAMLEFLKQHRMFNLRGTNVFMKPVGGR